RPKARREQPGRRPITRERFSWAILVRGSTREGNSRPGESMHSDRHVEGNAIVSRIQQDSLPCAAHVPGVDSLASLRLKSESGRRTVRTSQTSQGEFFSMSAPSSDRPVLAFTLGDVAGIGPEVVVQACADERVANWCRPLVVG